MPQIKMTAHQFVIGVGKVAPGDVIDVDDATAERFAKIGIAGTSAGRSRASAEARMAELRKEQAELAAQLAADQEGSAAWDVDRRDLGRAEARVEDLERAHDEALELAKDAKAGRKGRGNEPGPVNTAPQDRV